MSGSWQGLSKFLLNECLAWLKQGVSEGKSQGLQLEGREDLNQGVSSIICKKEFGLYLGVKGKSLKIDRAVTGQVCILEESLRLRCGWDWMEWGVRRWRPAVV